MSIIRQAAATAVAVLLAHGAQGQTVTVSGDTTGKPVYIFGPADIYEISIRDPLTFRAETVPPTGSDSVLALYRRADFDPDVQRANWLAFDDDGGAGLLSRIDAADGPFEAGDHVLLVSQLGHPAPYVFELDGAVLGFLPVGPSGSELAEELALESATIGFLVSGAQFDSLPGIVGRGLDLRGRESARRPSPTNSTAHITLNTPNGRISSDIHAWADIGHKRANGDAGLHVGFTYTQVGVDMLVHPGVAVGLAGGAGAFDARSDGSEAEGDAFWVQPYVGLDLGVVRGTLSGAVSFANYDDFTSAGLSGEADGLSFWGGLFVAHDIHVGGGTTLSPFATATVGTETIRNFDGALAGQPDIENDYLDAGLGVEVSHTFTGMPAMPSLDGRVFGAAELQYRDSSAPSRSFATDELDRAGLGAGFALGTDFALASDISAGVQATLDGVGTDVLEYGARGRIEFQF